MAKIRKKETHPQKESKKRQEESIPQEKKSKWQDFLNRHSAPKRLEDKTLGGDV